MEKRRSPRIRKRLVVEYELGPVRGTGFTRDLGATGFYVVTNRLPMAGKGPLRAWLHQPDGRRIEVSGRVTRVRRGLPGSAAHGGGFGLLLDQPGEEYLGLVAAESAPAPGHRAPPA